MLGGTFVVLLPLVTGGTGTASALTITSASLGTAALTAPALPLLLGTSSQGATSQLVLQFDNSHLTVRGTYLLTVRGNYQFGGETLSFTVNRFVSVTLPSRSVQGELQRWVVFDAVRAELASLPNVDQVANGQALLTFVQGRPEFVATGIYPDSSSVWARFADGFPLVIGNDFYPSSGPPSAGPAINLPAPQARSTAVSVREAAAIEGLAGTAQPTEIPLSSSARLLSTVDQWGDPTVISNLTSWLSAQSYHPVAADASVAGLETVAGDGIFFFRTHGAFLLDANFNSVYALWTSTVATAATDLNYIASGDLGPTDSRLVFYTAMKANKIAELHYGITAKFVEKYWGAFSKNSLVYIDACNSGVDQNFTEEIFAKNASVYAGWPTSFGDPFGAETARLVFDRLLGANQFCPETNPSSVTQCVPGSATPPVFAQRPFDYTSVTSTEFKSHDLGGGLTFSSSTMNPSTSSFGLLAPSIEFAVTYEATSPPTLFITGSFGNDMGSVYVGGVALANVQWSPTLITADLPASLVGDVYVAVRGHTSNVARLTEWEGDFTSNTIGIMSLKQKVVYHVVFRADIRQYRKVIHKPPVNPLQPTVFAINSESGGTWTCNGTGIVTAGNTTFTYTWTGSGNLLVGTAPNPPVNYFLMSGSFINSPMMNVYFAVNDAGSGFAPCNQNLETVAVSPPPEGTTTTNVASFVGLCFPGNGFVLNLDQNATILGSNFALSANACGFPTNFSQSTIQWGSIPAMDNTAPDPLSAR